MGSYIPATQEQRAKMLETVGLASTEELFAGIPSQVRLQRKLQIPEGMPEMEVFRKMGDYAEENRIFRHIFRGAGAYDHYIPSIVKEVVSKEEFITAYTPYQAEISQGILQSIFEYQTMICELTGMDASNASVYDGASAAAESVFMCRDRKHTRILVSETTNPQVLEVINTYCHGRQVVAEIVPAKKGSTDLDALKDMLDETVACFYVQQPNYYGILEDGEACAKLVHDKGGKLVMGCNPIALAIVKTPGECGADIAVGEGQPLGMPLSFGGPYLGFMAATRDMMRKLPGRIVGETVDTEGKRGFVLTLQAREQHIRREKAGSNICSNEALCALTASVYLAAMGPGGLKQAAVSSTSKAHYLQKELEKAGLHPVYEAEFFHEFVTDAPRGAQTLLQSLERHGYLGGLLLPDGNLLWCTTEKNTKAEMDELVSLVREVEADETDF